MIISMEDFLKELFTWICQNGADAAYFLFVLLLLSGLFLPVSEDLTIIVGGLISSHCGEGGSFIVLIFFFVWLGSLLSAWEAYWIGRLIGPKIFTFPVVHYFIKPRHIRRAEELLTKYGIYSFFIARFFPGGVRNGFFFTCGLTRMPFHRFIVRDALAGTVTTSVLFSIGFFFGANIDALIHNVTRVDEIGIGIAVLIIIGFIVYYYRKIKKK